MIDMKAYQKREVARGRKGKPYGSGWLRPDGLIEPLVLFEDIARDEIATEKRASSFSRPDTT
jgi:hypothetical protein